MHAGMNRTAYIATNLLANALAPVTAKVHGRGALGVDRDPRRVAFTLERLAPAFKAADISVVGGRVVELGPGRTPELLAAFALAGAKEALGYETTLESGTDLTPSDMDELARLLEASAPGFIEAAGGLTPASPDAVSLAAYNGSAIPLEAASVDLLYSRTVLEHVRGRDVRPLIADMRRVLKPGASMVHLIDFRDHMKLTRTDEPDGWTFTNVHGDWLDALTYSDRLFDAMFSRRPVYINRLRSSDWRSLLLDAGFELLHVNEDSLPLASPRHPLDARFRSYDQDVLETASMIVTCRKPQP